MLNPSRPAPRFFRLTADGVVVNCYFDRPARPTAIVLPTGLRFQSLRVHAAELHLVVVPSDPRPPPRAGPDKPAPSAATKRSWSIEDSLLQLVPPARAASDSGASDADEAPDDDFASVHASRASKRFAGPSTTRTAGSDRSGAAPSPLPPLLPPLWSPSATGLSAGARTQLAAELHEILPHLRAIVAGTAVSWRRDAFFGTGRSRAQLRDQFGYAGIASDEGEALVELLMDWFVGDEPENMKSVALVTDVLVPEAIIRLLMTRRHVGYADAERLVAAAGFARPNVQS